MSSVGIRRDVLLRTIRIGVHEACLGYLRRKRRRWVRQWIERRDLLGASSRLICELASEDPNSYLNMLRLSVLKFNELLEMVTPLIQKKDTNMRQSIPCKTKLEITLRFLATGDSLKSLQYLFRVPHNTISTFLPEVLDAIYNVLQQFIKVF